MNRYLKLTALKFRQSAPIFSNFTRYRWSQQLEAKEQAAEYLEIPVTAGGVVKLPLHWLRDRCCCSSCKHPISGLRIRSDGHLTSLSVSSLLNRNDDTLEPEKTLWDSTTALTIPFARLKYQDLMSSEQSVSTFLTSIFKYGIAIVDGVPATSDDTKRVMERFGPIWRTFWGEVYHVVADLTKFAHPSYTGNAVELHTDTNYYHEGAGLQAFHVLHHNGDGAINCFVDGFQVAKTIKRQQPEIYKCLSQTPVPFKYNEEVKKLHLVNDDTIFKHHPITKNLLQVRYTPYDLDIYRCQPQEQMDDFYLCLKVFREELNKPDNRHWIHLKPGTVLVTDNWRVLHGRSEFTGSRTLCGMYVSRSDYLSRLRTLSIIK